MTLENLNQIRFFVFFGVLGVMLICESFWPKRRWETSRAKRLGFHLGLSVFNTVLTRVLVVAPLLFWLHFLLFALPMICQQLFSQLQDFLRRIQRKLS